MLVYVATACVLATYLVAVWLVGSLLHLKGSDLLMLRSGLTLIGFAGAAVFLWHYNKNLRPHSATGPKSDTGADLEIGSALKRAETALKSSALGKKAALSNLPAVLIIGDSGAAKTSTLMQSGLVLEHLAGQIHQDKDITPTRPANVWYARNTVFIEVGGSLQDDPTVWRRMFRWLRPRRLSALRDVHAPRAVIVCFPANTFVQPGARELCASRARAIRQRLEGIARLLGIKFPVYVLFTKSDGIPFFADFTRSMAEEEAKQVVGATLPMQTSPGGLDAQADRLNSAFKNLVLSLCDKRMDLLRQEHDSQKLPGIYEFPRELRKLRPLIVQFLTDVCTPSELHASPFLRGFYFSGVRPVVINEISPRPVEREARPITEKEARATQMFRPSTSEGSQAIPQPQVIDSRKIPQWTFLHRFFNEVLLQDSLALGASKSSVKTNTFRKLVFATTTALCLLLALAFTISWFGNRALENEVLVAAAELGTAGSAAPGADFTNALARLDSMRQLVQRLSSYETGAPPLRLRFGLYTGHGLYPRAREIYFLKFNQLLFSETQASMLDLLKRLPLSPSANDDYGATSDTLKGYLITTSNHDKSTQMFLSPLLFNRWLSNRQIDQRGSDLARAQFDFYSEELKADNPFSSENDSLAVERARRYLSLFADSEKVYRSMLAEAAQKNPPISFNRDVPGSAEVVRNTREISGAYSKAGWTSMRDAIKNAPRFFSGEQWVLGDQKAAGIDLANLERELTAKYTSDFIEQWQQFVRAGSIVRFGGYKDAARKLNVLASPQSPQLAMLCVVSRNTAVEEESVKTAFQPIQLVVPPSCTNGKYNSDANTPYMNALIALGAIVEQIGNSPGAPNEALVTQATTNVTQARITVRQLVLQAHLDKPIQDLLEDPITQVERLLSGAGSAQLNEKGKALCTQFGNLMNAYPFIPGAAPATVMALNAFFQPQDGAFGMFRTSNAALFVGQGAQLVPNSSAGVPLNPAFVRFAQKAALFSAAVYPGNSKEPRLAYTLRPHPLEGAEITLTIDKQVLNWSNPTAKEFIWTGVSTSEIILTVQGASQRYTGSWSPFEFFRTADNSKVSGGTYTLQWKPRQGQGNRPSILSSGKELVVEFDLEGPGAPIFQKNYFADFRCVSEVAK